MELKAAIEKPITQVERNEFIIHYNHQLGYEVRYVPDENNWTRMEAWGKTTEEIFADNKVAKLAENTTLANWALYQTFDIAVGPEEDQIVCQFIYDEKTERNLNSAAVMIISGTIETKEWTDEQGITVQLSADDIVKIGMTFDAFANATWAKWGAYKQAIDAATTQAELDAIELIYPTPNEVLNAAREQSEPEGESEYVEPSPEEQPEGEPENESTNSDELPTN